MSGREKSTINRIFFDGDCGMCHRGVAFFSRRAASLEDFRFAPLQGETCRAVLPETRRRELPDSVVVVTTDGDVLTEGAATVFLLRQMAGVYRWLGGLLRCVPLPVLNVLYQIVARLRKLISRSMNLACAVPSAALRERLDP